MKIFEIKSEINNKIYNVVVNQIKTPSGIRKSISVFKKDNPSSASVLRGFCSIQQAIRHFSDKGIVAGLLNLEAKI